MSNMPVLTEKEKTATSVSQPYVSREEFLREYSDREDGFKYEFNAGLVEKSSKMNQEQTTLFLFLSRIFCQTQAFQEGGGLTAETDVNTTEVQLRRPDICYFSAKQIERMKEAESQIPTWLAEVISKNDTADKINVKLAEYFAAGVKCVWHIYPTSKQVHVFTSPEDVTICMGKTTCSASPAVPDFKTTPDELFA